MYKEKFLNEFVEIVKAKAIETKVNNLPGDMVELIMDMSNEAVEWYVDKIDNYDKIFLIYEMQENIERYGK